MIKYQELKKNVIDNELLKFETDLSNIKLIDEETIQATIKGKKQQLKITSKAFSQLCKICQVPEVFAKKFSKTITNQKKLDVSLIEVMRKRLAVKNNIPISLLGSRQAGKVVGIGCSVSSLSNQSFFQLFEETQKKYGLELSSASTDVFGNTVLKTVLPNHSVSLEVDNKNWKEDETYTPGIVFHNDVFNGTSVSLYQLRQICTNGLIGMTETDAMRLQNLSAKSLQDFYESLSQCANNNFASPSYNQNVQKAINVSASLAEVEKAYKTLSQYIVDEQDLFLLDQYVPYRTICSRYKNQNVHVAELSQKQKQNANTRIPLWDILNGVTDFASHQIGNITISDSSRSYLQQYSGAILGRKVYDTENLVPSLH